jgi:signal transduction histidine kinase
VRARPDGRHLLIEVTDTGVGMEPADTVAAEGGFGLAQVRERVGGLGSGSSAGQVQVQSQPGQGTTVRLKLPLQQSTAS